MNIANIQRETREFLEGLPCDKLKIPNCQELRVHMNQSLGAKHKGCSSCKKAAIKSKYKKIIFNSLKNIPDD